METCTNCGATLRSGAKFCTTCGTRLNSAAASNDGWVTQRPGSPENVQETTVVEAVSSPAQSSAAGITDAIKQRERDRWRSAHTPASESDGDPASRFISALDQDPKPAEVEQPEEASDTPSNTATWVTPPPDELQGARPSTWNFQTGTASDNEWKAPSSWNAVATETAEPEDDEENVQPAAVEEVATTDVEVDSEDERQQESATVIDVQPASVEDVATLDEDEADEDEFDDVMTTDNAGFSDGGHEVDYLSGDENIAISGPDVTKLEPEDARARAITLVDELRRMVRMMPGGGMHDTGATAMTLTEASLNVSDFGDLREVLTELQDDPRDIQALTNLAKTADRIELLLDEHQSLVDSIETALKELTGQQ